VTIARLVAADTHRQEQIEALTAALQKVRAQLELTKSVTQTIFEQSVKLPSNYKAGQI
jgi:hypothetical protein